MRFEERHVRRQEGHVTEEKPSNSGIVACYAVQNDDGYDGIWGFGVRRRLRKFIKPLSRNTAANAMSSQIDVVTGCPCDQSGWMATYAPSAIMIQPRTIRVVFISERGFSSFELAKVPTPPYKMGYR